MHGDGDNNGTVFTDHSIYAHTVTRTGNVVTSTAQSKFGGASLYFPGAENLLFTAGSEFDIGTGPFTIEDWLYVINYSGVRTIISKYSTWTSSVNFSWHILTDGKLRFIGGNSAAINISSNSAVPTNTWFHAAVCRGAGPVTRQFIDGTTQTATSSSAVAISNSQTAVKIGMNSESTEFFYGYMDDLCVDNIAYYTGNFSVPTSARPNP
jgi:hypothetical protein